MSGWGFSGILLLLLIFLIFIAILKFVVNNAIQKSEFKRSTERDLKKIQDDIASIKETLKSKDQQ